MNTFIEKLRDAEQALNSQVSVREDERNRKPEVFIFDQDYRSQADQRFHNYIHHLITQQYGSYPIVQKRLKDEISFNQEIQPIVDSIENIVDNSTIPPIINSLSKEVTEKISVLKAIINFDIKTKYFGYLDITSPGKLKKRRINELFPLGYIAGGATLVYAHQLLFGGDTSFKILMGGFVLVGTVSSIMMLGYEFLNRKERRLELQKLPETIKQTLIEDAKYLGNVFNNYLKK